MSTPSWKPVTSPPPDISSSPQRAPWPAPTTVPVGTPPVPGTTWPPAPGDKRMCLRRPGDAQLTDCGRFLFFDVVAATDNKEEVTCQFCLWRIERGTARA